MSDPIHCESSWPLVVVIEDCYIPEYAEEIVSTVATTSTETCGAVIYTLAVYVEMKLRNEALN